MLLRTKVMLIFLIIFALGTAFVLRKSGMTPSIIENDKLQLAQETQQQDKTTVGLVDPLPRSSERITKKDFGLSVSPGNSPVQPERFSGIHTGVDLEVFPEELNSDVQVKALCDGKIMQKKFASGYGGLLVTDCILEEQKVTVVYGHLKLDTIKQAVGSEVKAGDILGLLGEQKSRETDGERKHLHLGVHKGEAIDIRGYVASKNELQNWLDPKKFL